MSSFADLQAADRVAQEARDARAVREWRAARIGLPVVDVTAAAVEVDDEEGEATS
jgi:hypothetical protein